MAAERFVRGPVDREDGLAKTSLSNNFSLRGPWKEPKQFCLAVEAFPLP